MIKSTDWCAIVEYCHRLTRKRVWLANHNLVESEKAVPFATGGDSGAMVYLKPEEGQPTLAEGILIATTLNDAFAIVLSLHLLWKQFPVPYRRSVSLDQGTAALANEAESTEDLRIAPASNRC